MIPTDKTTRADRAFRIAVVALLAAIALALWDRRPDTTPKAFAQIPDSGLQRNVMIDEQRVTNDLLERILKHIETRPIKVQSVGTDETKGRLPRPAARSPGP